jgi:carbon storage regulator CsrA
MLVITRREGEEVVIGDPNNPIGVVRIASIKGDRVRVAFDFPRAIDVHRREVADQIIAGVPQPSAAERKEIVAEITVSKPIAKQLNGHCNCCGDHAAEHVVSAAAVGVAR